MAPSAVDVPDPTLHLPRILCLHGGGTTGEVFRLQCRSLIRDLASAFRLVFAEGPFYCPPHPDIIPVYEGMGPYRRWMRWLPSHAAVDDDTSIEQIEVQMRDAMEEDERKGADGEWVGLLGFSQGAKVAASVLYESQLRSEEGKGTKGIAGGDWRFGVLMAGSAPLVSLREKDKATASMARPGAIAEYPFTGTEEGENKLKFPTVHVHGLEDSGLQNHRKLRDLFCEKGTTKLIEWDGDHRVAFKRVDVDPIVDAIMSSARQVGALKT